MNKANLNQLLAIFTTLLLVAGCGGNGDSTANQNTPEKGPNPFSNHPGNQKYRAGHRDGSSVALYVKDPADNQHYALFAQRKAAPKEWTVPGGLIDPNQTFADAAARELYEETVKFYGFDSSSGHAGTQESITAADLLAAPYSEIIGNKSKDIHMLFFVKATTMTSALTITTALATPGLSHKYTEMQDYKWVPLNALKSVVNAIPKNPNGYGTYGSKTINWTNTTGSAESITIWAPAMKSLTANNARKILNSLPN